MLIILVLQFISDRSFVLAVACSHCCLFCDVSNCDHIVVGGLLYPAVQIQRYDYCTHSSLLRFPGAVDVGHSSVLSPKMLQQPTVFRGDLSPASKMGPIRFSVLRHGSRLRQDCEGEHWKKVKLSSLSETEQRCKVNVRCF